MKFMVVSTLLAAFALSGSALAAEKYTLDSSHSQILFEYDHLGYSTTYSMFSGFGGEIMLDKENPGNSSITVNIATDTLITGWDGRTQHLLSADFFDAGNAPTITFTSTNIDVTGDETAKVTGDLTVNGVTKPISLDAKLNKMGTHPQKKIDWVGFDATTTLMRSDFDMGMFAPFVSDEVKLVISVEAGVEQ